MIWNIVRRLKSRIRTWELKRAYTKGRSLNRSGLQRAEQVDQTLVTNGKVLKDQVIERYFDKYKTNKYRILFELPPNGTGVTWFRDLAQCLAHTGIPCALVRSETDAFFETWEQFQPNVFVSMDTIKVLRSHDWEQINRYKRRQGCLRLLTPVNKYRFPETGMSREDVWRLKLACSGQTVDAFFSMMVPEYFERFMAEWADAGFKYLCLANACNPFSHFPVDGSRENDYFMVTSYGSERVDVVYRYLKPIFSGYYGLWAGPSWGFGEGVIERDQLRHYYAHTRIALNPLQEYLVRFPMEITERAFSAAACGAFQITNWTQVTERFFLPDELCWVHSEKEFESAFEYYVNRPDERNAITLRGLERVYKDHTYFHRVDNLVSFLDECERLF